MTSTCAAAAPRRTAAVRPAIARLSVPSIRWGIWVLAALLLPAVVTEVRSASTRPFWSDEVCTFAVASRRAPAAIWEALAHATDTQPPFFYILTALPQYIVTDPHLAYRIFPMAAFFLVPFCVYLFVARRVGVAAGLVAALIPLSSGFQGYASEARPYSLEVAFFALALVCWQRLDRSRWYGVPLALALASAVASHYYAVMALPAFVAAEALRWYRTREWRVAAWAPFVVAVLPVPLV